MKRSARFRRVTSAACRVGSSIAVVLVCASFSSAPAHAAVATVTYEVVDNHAEVTGCNPCEGTLTILDTYEDRPVAVIRSHAFSRKAGLDGVVTIPDSVTTVGPFAFRGASGIDGLVLSETLAKVQPYAFEGMTGLSGSLIIPNSVEEIGENAFAGAGGVSELVLSEALWHIDTYAFRGMTGLDGSLAIPDNVEEIGFAAFEGAASLDQLVLGDSVDYIGQRAFKGAGSLNGTLVIPDSVTEIDSEAFLGAASLDGLEFGSSLTYIHDNAFSGAEGLTGTLQFPDSVSHIGERAFFGSQRLEQLVLGGGLKSIGRFAFAGANALSGTLTIPDQVESISGGAFYGASNLDELVLGASVHTVGDSAFKGAESIDGVLAIPDSVREIGPSAFEGTAGLDGVTFGSSVSVIGDFAFRGARELGGAITFPNSVTSIGEYAFYNARKLESVKIGTAVETIGRFAFAGAEGLTDVTFLGERQPTFEQNAFLDSGTAPFYRKALADQEWLDDVDGHPVHVVGSPRFTTDPVGASVARGDRVNLVGVADAQDGGGELSYQWYQDGYPVLGATSPTLILDGVHVGDSGIYTLEAKGWAGTSVSAGAIVSVIAGAPNALYFGVWYEDRDGTYTAVGCDSDCVGVLNLADAISGIPVTAIADEAFINRDGIVGTLVIPDSVTTIGASAFQGVTGITALTLGTSVERIGVGAFYGATALRDVRFLADGAGPAIGNHAFTDTGAAELFRKSSAEGAWADAVGHHPLTAVNPPAFATSPSSSTVVAGQSITLNASTVPNVGEGDLAFQWLKDGQELGSETATTLSIPSVEPDDAGVYSLRATGWSGASVSEAAIVTVASAPTPTPAPTRTEPPQTSSPAPPQESPTISVKVPQAVRFKLPSTLKRTKSYRLPTTTIQGQQVKWRLDRRGCAIKKSKLRCTSIPKQKRIRLTSTAGGTSTLDPLRHTILLRVR